MTTFISKFGYAQDATNVHAHVTRQKAQQISLFSVNKDAETIIIIIM